MTLWQKKMGIEESMNFANWAVSHNLLQRWRKLPSNEWHNSNGTSYPYFTTMSFESTKTNLRLDASAKQCAWERGWFMTLADKLLIESDSANRDRKSQAKTASWGKETYGRRKPWWATSPNGEISRWRATFSNHSCGLRASCFKKIQTRSEIARSEIDWFTNDLSQNWVIRPFCGFLKHEVLL
jgi:hypothetical protein